VPFHRAMGQDVPMPHTCIVNAMVPRKYTPKYDELFVMLMLAMMLPFVP
jgi:hypothetical protein